MRFFHQLYSMYFFRNMMLMACCLWGLAVTAQNDKDPAGYLLEMRGKDLSSFAVLDAAVANRSIFFTGEDHRYVKDNTLVEMKFLRYLYQQAGVRNLILELGPARGFLLNKYVNGDTSMYAYLEAATSKDYLRFYRNLKYFNDSLPISQKISVWGIDVERFCDMPVLAMACILPTDKPIPEDIQLSVETIQGLSSYYQNRYKSRSNSDGDGSFSYYSSSTRYSCERTADSLIADFERQQDLYREYLGSQFELFATFMSSLKDRSQWSDYGSNNMVQQYVYREQFMYKQFRDLIHKHPEGKFYGQFGRCHISATTQNGDCNWYNHNSIARRINTSSDLLMQNRVLALAIFYPADYYDDIQQELNIYTQANTGKGFYLYKTGQNNKDSLLHSRYQYVIINNKEGGSPKKRPESSETKRDKVFYEVTGLDLGYNMVKYNYSNLNGILSGGSSFKSQMPAYSISIMGIAENFASGGAALQFSPQQKIQTSQNTSVKIGSIAVRLMLGHSFVPTPRLSILPYGSLGFGGQYLSVVTDSAGNKLSPSFGSQQVNSYNNPATIIGAGMDIRFAISYSFALRVSGGYDYDISYYRWRYNNNLLTSSPKTSLTASRIGAGITLLIP